MKRNVIINGLISGAVVTTFMMISMGICYSTPGMQGSMVVGYASMIIAFSMIFVGIKNQRDKVEGGTISFGRAFLMGLYIALIASTMYVLGWAIEYHFFLPDFMDKYVANQMENLSKSNVSAETMTAQLEEMKHMGELYKNPVFFALFTYMEILPVGIIVSLIAAAILKRKPVPIQQS